MLAEQGTCRQELWPDEKPAPAKPERVLISDSEKHHLDATPHPIALDDVLMVGDDSGATAGAAHVTATVLEQKRDDKVIVFKKKRRHNYRRKNGHRQHLTVLRITDIVASGAVAEAAAAAKE